VHGGSIIYQIECQIHYMMQCLALIASEGTAINVRGAVNSDYNREVQALSRQLAWGHPNVESWYKNQAGQVVNNSPFSLQQFWEETHDMDPTDFEFVEV
jgi:4-hydroxyacetophenone monooxygenase